LALYLGLSDLSTSCATAALFTGLLRGKKKMKKEKDYQQGRVRKNERKRRANNKLFP
jgi:hypothetical protein